MTITADAWSDPSFDLRIAETETTRAIETLERLGDDDGLGMAYKVRGDHFLARAQWAVALADYERGIVHASRSDVLLEDRLRSRLRNAVLWGSTPALRIIELFDEHARRQPVLMNRVGYLSSLALAHAMAGHREQALALLEQGVARGREVWGTENTDSFASGFVGYVLDDLDLADRALRETIQALERLNETGERSTLLAFLALVRFEAGASTEEVKALAEEARSLTAQEDAASEAGWRAGLALAMARDGDSDEAERLVREAAQAAVTTDFVYLRGVVARAAAMIAEMRGETALALERHNEALSHFEEKGDLPDAERARAAIRRLSAA